MQITRGLFSNMVVQRNRKNVSEAVFAGVSESTGPVMMSVKKNGKMVKGFDGIKAGKARNGEVKGCITGLPAGGPYDIILSISKKEGIILDKTVIKNILVGDVWILAGQSNMEGVGYRKHAPKPHPMVRAFFMDDRWGIGKEPIHELSTAVDQVHVDLRGGIRTPNAPHIGTGPGLAFALEMNRISKVPQGVIACAHGGTSMAQWSPELKDQGGKSLYGAMLRRFHKNGGKVAGMFWYQGCSDTSQQRSADYTKTMVQFVKAIRKDFRHSDLPVVMVQIARVCNSGVWLPFWTSVQDQQRLLPQAIKNLLTVPAIDLALDDGVHISGFDQIRVGVRGARAMSILSYNSKAFKPPIILKNIGIEKDRFSGFANVYVAFENVAGSLIAQGRPTGFELSQKQSEITNSYIYRTDLRGNTVILKTAMTPEEATNCFLFYGFGANPYCNITDKEDSSLPVFGPMRIGKPRAFTPYILALRVSAMLPSAGKLHSLAYPSDQKPLQLRTIDFDNKKDMYWTQNFCSMHAEIAQNPGTDQLLYYAFRFRCSEPMKLKLHLGYDGPVKAWIDGAERYFDPDGVNPALPFDATIPVDAAAGEHEVIVALGTNNGAAWGVFLRLGRSDVPMAKLLKGSESYVMPEIVG